jgi:hypothetical protein
MSSGLNASIFVNMVVLIAILAVMLVFYAHAVYLGHPSVILYKKGHQSTASTFWFYFGATFCLLLTYAEGYSAKHFGHEKDLLANVVLDTLGDLASLFTLAAAWAYSRARDFSAESTMLTVAIGTGFLAIWYLAWRTLAPETLFYVLLQEAPGVALSIVSTVALGWAFFVRWGGLIGGIYLLIRVGYGVLQLPANLRIYAESYLKDAGASLDISFAWLAGGKVLLAIAFLALLFRSDLPIIAITTPKFAPNGAIDLAPEVRRGLLRELAIAFVMAIIAAILTDTTCTYLTFLPWCSSRH